jgi:glycosyltransferase involved in cell wall biosynthesis
LTAVTVVVTATGRASFLRTALDSIRNQLGLSQIVEVIVSENSNDRGTEAVVREFANLPVRYLFRQPPLPIVAHWFSTLREARTPYVAVLNDDDWWSSGHIAQGIRELEASPESVAYATSSLFIADEAHKNPRWIDSSAAMWLLAGKPSWTSTWTLEPERMLALCWAYTPFHASSLIARTDAVHRVLDEFESEMPNDYTLDRMIFARLALQGALRYSPIPDTFVRWHDGNLMKRRSAETLHALVRSTTLFVERIARESGWSPADVWKTHLTSMPAESETEVLGRLREAFTLDDLEQYGLTAFFHQRPAYPRLIALRGIAANTKRLLLGGSF